MADDMNKTGIEASAQPQHFIDGPGGRLVAACVLVVGIAILVAFHWEDLFPPPEAEVAGNPELAACIAERAGHVDKMIADGVIDAAQADSFRARAIAFCQQQFPPE